MRLIYLKTPADLFVAEHHPERCEWPGNCCYDLAYLPPSKDIYLKVAANPDQLEVM